MQICSVCRRDGLSWEDTLSLASFLGEKLRNLHLLPLPPLDYSIFSDYEQHLELVYSNCHMEAVPNNSNIQVEWEIFIKTLMKKRKDVTSRLSKWYAYAFTEEHLSAIVS